MKTILIGSFAFLIWSGISTYFYVCQIKGLCINTEVVSETAVEVEFKAPEVKPKTVEQEEPQLVSPGGFTLHHLYNHQEIIKDEKLTPYLDELKSYLNQQKDARITITGFADAVGPEQYNYELGMNRAKYVEGLLVSSGISSEKLAIDSKGEAQPVASNDTKEGRAQNRRTEIELK
jgi:OOP family OmpA-OmpF porin